MKNLRGEVSEIDGSLVSESNAHTQTLGYFILAILGFSFWFFMAVPFASHRESYWWLGMVHSQQLVQAFSSISKTYRPLAQAATWFGFLILNPSIFPTSVFRQALLQGFIYGTFVFSWWLIYLAATQRRLFALLALLIGCFFFSGYVQLFHIYGIFYVSVMLILGALLRFHASSSLDKREVWVAVVATLLGFWHPFATALFVGFYVGFYLDTFSKRSRAQHIQAILILLINIVAIDALVVVFPTRTETMHLNTRLFGFLVSYKTNEVDLVRSLIAFLLAQTVIFSMELSPRLKLVAFALVSVLSVVFLVKGLPLLLVWLCTVLTKLFRLRCWSLFFLTLTAALLPFGGGIGTPIYALFAIIVAAYVTALGWSHAEKALSFMNKRFIVGAVLTSVLVLLMVRAGIEVPIVTKVALPLLTERERTYQLENVLLWLHDSAYCGYDIAFAENADNPIDSVDSAITRRNRPPASLQDVQLFWDSVLRCRRGQPPDNKAATAIVTFGGPVLAKSSPIFVLKGRYAGDASVWIGDSQR